jgi:hypothetical protein
MHNDVTHIEKSQYKCHLLSDIRAVTQLRLTPFPETLLTMLIALQISLERISIMHDRRQTSPQLINNQHVSAAECLGNALSGKGHARLIRRAQQLISNLVIDSFWRNALLTEKTDATRAYRE